MEPIVFIILVNLSKYIFFLNTGPENWRRLREHIQSCDAFTLIASKPANILWFIINTEAYHPEASNFCLDVGNYAEVFHLTNQKHGIIFCPNMESVDGVLFQYGCEKAHKNEN